MFVNGGQKMTDFFPVELQADIYLGLQGCKINNSLQN